GGTRGGRGRRSRGVWSTKSSACTRSAAVPNVLLGVTGSVAALKTPELYAALTQAGHRVRIVATQASLYFFDPTNLDKSRSERDPEIVVLDQDEWLGREEGRVAQRGDA